ncbi:hypothetical protein [Vibrio atlanticus]|uniref:hypothetical protein n=1 Tax=Vibrio atlanticus TaxID=693153 RepID=UPI000EFAB20B|nr:hypothetical protein [Vibrio atlanticus]
MERNLKEIEIRDNFASRLIEFRPDEKLISCEQPYSEVALRTDMQTIDKDNTIRIWEFKVTADYSAIGQLIVYLHLKRKETQFGSNVVGVLAATEIPSHIREAVIASGLNIELYTINKSVSGLEQYLAHNEVSIFFPKETVI